VKSLTLIAAFLLCSSTASAQKEDQPLPKDLPPFGPEKPLQAPDVKPSKLDNGLTVWLVPQTGFPKISYSFAVFGGGLASDPTDHPGLADVLAATIDQGTKTRTARQIAEEIQAAGGDVSARASRDTLRISTGVLSSKAAEGLSVLADIVQNASFPDKEVDLARRNLTDSLDLQEADPHFLANRAMARVLFGDGPYSVVSPTKQSLSAMTAADLRAEFARRVRPDQAVLVVAGDFTADKILALVRDKFASWRAPATPVVAAPPPPSSNPPHTVFFVARPNSVQTTLSLATFGPRRNDPDYAATEVANTIYGGTFGSRLTTNIREDKGYTYSPGSFLQGFRSAGTLRTEADVRNAVTAPSLNEIFYEMNRLATTSPTDRELQQAKRFLVGIEAIQLQSRDAVAGELASLWIQGLPPSEIGAYGQKISAMTAADVDAVASKYFPASRTAIVAVGEEKVIRDALAPFGLPITPAP
jgi:zinc protease